MQTSNDRNSTRQARLRTAAGVAVAVAVIGGIAYAVYATKTGPKVMELTTASGQTVGKLVQGHSKMQAYGPNWSLHRLMQIEPYLRGVAHVA